MFEKELQQKMIVEERIQQNHHLYELSHLEYVNRGVRKDVPFHAFLSQNIEHIVDIIKNNQNITISHLTNTNQIITIIEAVSEHHPILFVTKNKGFQNMGKQKKNFIRVISFGEARDAQVRENEIVVWDIFNLHYMTYQPYLQDMKTHRKNVVYAHKTQQEQLQQFYESQVIKMQENHPFQVSSGNIEQQLLKFIIAEQSQIIKQDVVIFHNPQPKYISRISQLFRKNGLLNYVNIISEQGKELAQPNVANIFICKNVSELLSWKYSLEKVYFVFDYGEDMAYYYDYSVWSYVLEKGYANIKQTNRRVAVAGSDRLGQYFYLQDSQLHSQQSQISETKKILDIGEYCLRMMELGLYERLNIKNAHIKNCLDALKKIKIINKEKVINKELLKYLNNGEVNPCYLHCILKNINESKLVNMMVMCMSIFMTEKEIRKIQCEDDLEEDLNSMSREIEKRPSGIWRQTGYLHSSLDLLIKCTILTNRKQKNKQYQTVTIQELEEKFSYYSTILQEVKNKTKQLLLQFGIHEYLWEQQLELQQFDDVLISFISELNLTVNFFSGSRRLGYYSKASNAAYLPDKESFIFLLNERPAHIFLFQLQKHHTQLTISKCNYINDQVLLQAYGALPNLSKQSFGEAQLQFQNVSSSMFNHLTKFNSFQIENFEQQYDCSVESSEEMGMITIQCSKEKSAMINNKFNNILQKIKQMFSNQTRIVKISSTLSMLLGSGGQVQDLKVKENPNEEQFIYDTAIITNLSQDAGVEDLKDLFDEFFQVKDIQIHPKSNEDFNQAVIYFSSHKEYKKLYNYFNNCMFLGKTMLVKPYLLKDKKIAEDNYLLFEWNVWKSSGQALVEYVQEKDAINAQKQLRQVSTIQDAPIELSRKSKKLYVSGLKEKTDQRYLQTVLGVYGKIRHIQIRRHQSSKKTSYQSDYPIDSIISQAFSGQKLKYKSQNTMKGKNGYRSTRVRFQVDNQMKQVYFVLNDITDSIGTGRLYATPCFTYPLKLAISQKNHIQVYLDIIQGISQQLNRPKSFDVEIIKEVSFLYLIVKSNEQAQVDIIKTLLFQRLKSQELSLNVQDQSILLSDFGMENISSLEKEYACKFSPDLVNKKLKVLCKPNVKYLLEKEINSRLIKSCKYKINLHQKAFKYLQQHKSQYAEIEKQLDSLGFEDITKTVIIQGKLHQIQKAKHFLTILINNIGKGQNIQQLQADQICQICFSPTINTFKLERCGHKFCYQCLLMSIRAVLKDINLYPVKCPNCLQKIFICDLNVLLNDKDWKEIFNTSANCFVFRNPDKYTFCWTARCPQINAIESSSWFRCRQCKKGYCISCKLEYHPGMNCSEARFGSDRLLQDYMLKSGGRKCANKKCKAPIIRISGCYKVQCAKCKACMCFKCPPQSMVPYSSPGQTYSHMDKAHGGCF